MKKILPVLIGLALTFGVTAALAQKQEPGKTEKKQKKTPKKKQGEEKK